MRRLVLAVVALVAHAQLAAGSEMAFTHRSGALAKVNAVCARLAEESGGKTSCPSVPITIRVKTLDDAPSGVEAYVTMPDGPDGGCTITVVARALRDKEVLGHEACHCFYDHQDVGARGWLISDRAEIKARETRARVCAVRMLGR